MSEGPHSDVPAADGDLSPEEVDRLFDLLERAVDADTLSGAQLDRLVSILEQSVGPPAATDPETLAELISLLEEFILEPEDLSEVDVDGILSVFEEALAGVTLADRTDIEDVFDVVEEGLRDPTSLEPEDAERFQNGLQGVLFEGADPTESLTSLLSVGPFADIDETDEELDPFRIARLGTSLTQRVSGYSVESGVRTGSRMAYAAANAESPAELLTSVRAITLDELGQAGIDIGQQQSTWLENHEAESVGPQPVTRDTLEERGRQLIARSADIGREEAVHPSFAPTLDRLATDEARILRLLATEGPQGVISVYDRQYLPPDMELVARNLTMLGRDAGCRLSRRTPLYVQNLERLGLAEVLDEPIDDLKRYEVIEAQSHIELARERANRPRMRYKRIQLTDLGVEFCTFCFPFEVRAQPRGMNLRADAGE